MVSYEEKRKGEKKTLKKNNRYVVCELMGFFK